MFLEKEILPERIIYMLNLSIGYTVPDASMLYEGYSIKGNYITANVNDEKIIDVAQHFITVQEEPMFFILEFPTNGNDETYNSEGLIVIFHKDVFYIDGCSAEKLLDILKKYNDVLINDGLCRFGFASHKSGDEIMFEKYNVVTIFSKNIDKYNDFFERHQIPFTEKLITAWHTFSQDAPGESIVYKGGNRDIHMVIDELKTIGLYFAERREDL